VEKCSVIAPGSRLGPVTSAEQDGLIKQSVFYGRYEKAVDRESAYEILARRAEQAQAEKAEQAKKAAQAEKTGAAKTTKQAAAAKQPAAPKGLAQEMKEYVFGSTGPRGGKKDGVLQKAAKSAAKQVTSNLVRGVLGSLVGKK